MHIHISSVAALTMKAAAIEVFPRETIGLLLGWTAGEDSFVVAAYPQQDAYRTAWSVKTFDSEFSLVDWFDSALIGDFHSHPNTWPTLSRIRDSGREADEWELLNLPHSHDGFVALILGIWPKKRAPGWAFRWSAYTVENGQVIRAKLTISDRLASFQSP